MCIRSATRRRRAEAAGEDREISASYGGAGGYGCKTDIVKTVFNPGVKVLSSPPDCKYFLPPSIINPQTGDTPDRPNPAPLLCVVRSVSPSARLVHMCVCAAAHTSQHAPRAIRRHERNKERTCGSSARRTRSGELAHHAIRPRLARIRTYRPALRPGASIPRAPSPQRSLRRPRAPSLPSSPAPRLPPLPAASSCTARVGAPPWWETTPLTLARACPCRTPAPPPRSHLHRVVDVHPIVALHAAARGRRRRRRRRLQSRDGLHALQQGPQPLRVVVREAQRRKEQP